MEFDEYGRMFQAETRHWWYLGMATITCAILRRYVQPSKDLQILDAGCGTGAAMSTYLADFGRVVGLDISPLALNFCRMRNLATLVRASVMAGPFPSRHFDLVTSFDVLYSQTVTSDRAALAEFQRLLRPGGYLLLRLPAYDWLRGQHDRTIHTARRYSLPQVAQLLRDGGFHVKHSTYANTFLFPLALAKRLGERLWPPALGASDLSVETGLLNGLFRRVLSAEALLAARLRLPFGLSVIALGQKPIHP